MLIRNNLLDVVIPKSHCDQCEMIMKMTISHATNDLLVAIENSDDR